MEVGIADHAYSHRENCATPGLSDFMTSKYVRIAISSSLGLCFGAALGIALHNLGVGTALGRNVAVGIALGVFLGAVFGAALGTAPDAASAPKKAASDKALPHPLGLKKR